MPPLRFHDVSLLLRPDLPVYPGDPQFEQRVLGAHDPSEPNRLQTSLLSLGTHTGTHIDAPRHLFADGLSIDQLDPGLFHGPARVLDLRGRGPTLEAADLRPLDLAGVERLLLRTDNSDRLDGPYRPDFVHLGLDAAEHLKSLADLRLVGIDWLSIEAPDDPGLPVHRCLLGGERPILILESIDLRCVPAGEYLLVCLPLRIADADGAPARALLGRP